jgi:hypothetical protein
MNDMNAYREVFARLKPFSGQVPQGFLVDFVGALTDGQFRLDFETAPHTFPARHVDTVLPTIGDGHNGEGWFEAANWAEAAREARGRFTMITLGACYGAQAVGAYKTVQQINPMPCKLVLVEPEPDNFKWITRHLRNNGLDPADHWMVEMAISDTNAPVLFPVGSPGSGAQNCIATDMTAARENYAKMLMEDAPTALHNLLVNNTTGISKDLVQGMNLMAEIKFISAITLRELLGPLDFVDYLESDIQQSEIKVFPPFIDICRKKVRRIHIGTHGADVHDELHHLFARDGWEIIFSYGPNAEYESALGKFALNDGVLTVRNPDL